MHAQIIYIYATTQYRLQQGNRTVHCGTSIGVTRLSYNAIDRARGRTALTHTYTSFSLSPLLPLCLSPLFFLSFRALENIMILIIYRITIVAFSAFVRTRCTTYTRLAASKTESFRSSSASYIKCSLISIRNRAVLCSALPCLFFFFHSKRSSLSANQRFLVHCSQFYTFVFIESPRFIMFMSNGDDDPRTGRRPMIMRVMRMSYRLLTPIPVSRGSDTSRPSVFTSSRGTRLVCKR